MMPRPSDTPCEVESIIEFHGGDCLLLYAKGHHPAAEFLDACAYYGRDTLPQPPVIRHGWARFVPTKKEGFDFEFVESPKPGRGAFPVTILDMYP